MRRPVLILFVLTFYILFQFMWWAYLLIQLNDEVYTHKIENVSLKPFSEKEKQQQISFLEKKIGQRRLMVMGEGGVFLFLLICGALIMAGAYRKEMLLARQQKNFLLSITHEFKSPLASIKLYLQTILRHDLEKEKEKSFISSAVNDTERLNNLVENALLANLIDHKGYSFAKEDINFSALVRLLTQKFQQVPGHDKLNIQIEDGSVIFADKNAITILISNLLENAWKYSPGDKNVSVVANKNGKNVFLEIADQGVGIPAKEKQKIFNKFYRVGNEETRRTKGTGLGLFICKYIVDEHDGEIKIRDNIPHGTVVSVSFPSVEENV